jgi:hypothetical protein
MDELTGLPAAGSGEEAIWVFSDALTKFTVAKSVKKGMSGSEVARLLYEEVVCRFGAPRVVISDRDPRMNSRFWQDFMNEMGIKPRLAPSGRPQMDGQSERLIRSLLGMMRAMTDAEGRNWADNLPGLVFAYNDSVHAATGFTPFYLNFGRHPISPVQALASGDREDVAHPGVLEARRLNRALSEAKAMLERAAAQSEKTMQKRVRDAPGVKEGDMVMLKMKVAGSLAGGVGKEGSKVKKAKFVGPFKVLNTNGTTCNLELPASMRKVNGPIHVSDVKPYHMRQGVQGEQAPVPQLEVQKVLGVSIAKEEPAQLILVYEVLAQKADGATAKHKLEAWEVVACGSWEMLWAWHKQAGLRALEAKKKSVGRTAGEYYRRLAEEAGGGGGGGEGDPGARTARRKLEVKRSEERLARSSLRMQHFLGAAVAVYASELDRWLRGMVVGFDLLDAPNAYWVLTSDGQHWWVTEEEMMRLKSNATSSRLRSIDSLSTPLEVDGVKVFEVGGILAEKGKGKSLRYLIRWEGYSSAYDSWEPASAIPMGAVREFKGKARELESATLANQSVDREEPKRCRTAHDVRNEVSIALEGKALRVLELFSGTGSVGDYLLSILPKGSRVISLDTDRRATTAVQADILQWSGEGLTGVDILWASPPCTQYSRARATASTARDLVGADRLVLKTLELINSLQPGFWVMENPFGMLRLRPFMEPLALLESVTSYCHYGRRYRKDTSLWSNAGNLGVRRCNGDDPCRWVRDRKGHPDTAQSGSKYRRDGTMQKGSGSAWAVYPIPEPLLEAVFSADNLSRMLGPR